MKNQTLFFENPVYLVETSTIGAKKEKEGPLGKYLNYCVEDDLLKQKSHEYAEAKIHIGALKQLLNRAKLQAKDINCVFAGDLLDEIVGSSFALRELNIPYFGIYNACATFGEALILGASMVSSGHMNKVICSTSSHYATAERQYRFPLELGNQRTPLAQWTVTGAGATLLSSDIPTDIKITCGTIGRVIDFGMDDANDMGAVMAPAALDTIISHLSDTNRDIDYYDLILTGDLGHAGSRLFQKLAAQKGYTFADNYSDCGILIYNREAQNVKQGGSGAGCCNLVFNGYIYKKMLENKYKKVLLVPTGALLSKMSTLQGETIPAIAHAVSIEKV